MTRQLFSVIGSRANQAVWVAFVLVTCSSCSTGRRLSPFDDSGSSGGTVDRIRIEVENLNFGDATVWAMRLSQRIRVGRVTGKTDQNFTIEWNTAIPISFSIDVLSSPRCTTSEFLVEPDSRVYVSIPAYIGPGSCRAGRRR